MSTSKKSNKFWLGIAVAVVLPLSFYVIAKVLKKDHIKMPGHYISEKIEGKLLDGQMHYDTIFHRIPDLTFTNQLGEKVSLNTSLSGKILVVDFIFTHCPTTCPTLTENMKLLQRAFRKDPKKETDMSNELHLLSITVDPTRDSVQALRKFADRFGVDHDHWDFLTGDKSTIYNFARHDLGLSAAAGGEGTDDFIHTEKIVLIDADRYIRGYYNGLDSLDISRCAYEISLLSMEKKRQIKN
ncbi:MAG: SCO family protein [Bacteroidetes bacterium]|nr:SCO family protein [Bacteroidota bacterium]